MLNWILIYLNQINLNNLSLRVFWLNQKEKKDEIDNSAAFWKSVSADLQESLTLIWLFFI